MAHGLAQYADRDCDMTLTGECETLTDVRSKVETGASPSALFVSTQVSSLNGKGNTSGYPGQSGKSSEPEEDRTLLNEVATHFLELPYGAFLELVYRPDSTEGELGLLLWSPHATSVVDCFEHDRRLYVPPKLAATFRKNLILRLPRGVTDCPEPTELYVEICNLIRSYVDLPEVAVCLVAAFAISTWFLDNLAVAPYLCISGPPGSGKTTLLRLLHCLCRRAVLIGGSISPEVCSLQALLHPTLLLE